MGDGLLLVDKPAGPTSHDAVAAARRALGIRKIGHGGTLDPPATGLLVVLVGRATRLTRFASLLPKRYTGVVRFGWETSTDDATGVATTDEDRSWHAATEGDLRGALDTVAAHGEQVPPAISAKQQGGERVYRKVRRGEAVDLKPVSIRIDQIDMGPWDAARGTLAIDVTCGAGTYIRAIARDLGRALGSRAHLAELRRVSIGPWKVEDAVPLAGLAAGAELRPIAEAVAHLPRVELGADDAQRFKFGQKLDPTCLSATLQLCNSELAVFEGGTLIGVGALKEGRFCPVVGLAS